MKYWVQVRDRTLEVDLRRANGHCVVVLDGQPLELELVEGAPGVYTLLVDGKPYDLAAISQSGGYGLTVRGVPLDVVVQNERQRILSSVTAAKSVAEGKVVIRAPMPGLVTRVDVIEGEEVARGQRLLVLMAMKMENDIAAPKAGRVAQLKVSQGQTVEQGKPLVLLE